MCTTTIMRCNVTLSLLTWTKHWQCELVPLHWVRKLNNIAITVKRQSIFNPLTYFNNTLVHYRVFNNYCRKILAYWQAQVQVLVKVQSPTRPRICEVRCIYNKWGRTFYKLRLPLQLVGQEWFSKDLSNLSEMNDFTS